MLIKMTGMSAHRTVLLNETIEGLSLGKESVVLDATLGGGGHSEMICRKFPGIRVLALDQDEGAWRKAKPKFEKLDCKITFANSNFRDLDEALKKEGIERVDGIIFDLGLSSDQLESSGRGFSFLKNEPLLMTMKENPVVADLRALDVVNDWSEGSLTDIIRGYGEERFAKKIAKNIVEARREKRIGTTFDLVEIIKKSVPFSYRRGRIHFATKTFQALRIAVNDELETLKTGLEKGFEALRSGGRMSIISFHSLEDRITKRFFKEKEAEGAAKLLNKKPITPREEEVAENARSRSAKLRILEKI